MLSTLRVGFLRASHLEPPIVFWVGKSWVGADSFCAAFSAWAAETCRAPPRRGTLYHLVRLGNTTCASHVVRGAHFSTLLPAGSRPLASLSLSSPLAILLLPLRLHLTATFLVFSPRFLCPFLTMTSPHHVAGSSQPPAHTSNLALHWHRPSRGPSMQCIAGTRARYVPPRGALGKILGGRYRLSSWLGTALALCTTRELGHEGEGGQVAAGWGLVSCGAALPCGLIAARAQQPPRQEPRLHSSPCTRAGRACQRGPATTGGGGGIGPRASATRSQRAGPGLRGGWLALCGPGPAGWARGGRPSAQHPAPATGFGPRPSSWSRPRFWSGLWCLPPTQLPRKLCLLPLGSGIHLGHG